MDVEQLIHLEYLGLTPRDVKGFKHPFMDRTNAQVKEPHIHVLRLMRNPDYFYFTCKYLFNIDLAPFQCVILKELWIRRFPMMIGCRGMSKSFLLGLFALLKALLIQGSKVVICGSGFRQAKTVFNYAETIWHNSQMLQTLVSDGSRSGPEHGADRWILRLGESTITALPIGTGEKIRGERANCIVCDEFASVPRDIFEEVIAGFGVVNLSPINQAKRRARIRVMKNLGAISESEAQNMRQEGGGNQIILSGTASFQFNHFCDYWKKWKGIIESQGDLKKLRVVLGDNPEEGFSWTDYSIIRIPVHLLIDGFMDETQVARSKATVQSGIFANEFGACFSSDSNGFFKMSLIESNVTNHPVTPNVAGSIPIQFKPMTKGNPTLRYFMGVDPASESDNFSIVVLEAHDTHARVVYCWTTDKERFRARLKNKMIEEKDYYGYCARKIRDLLKSFPCEIISIDAQGGGGAVLEALSDTDKLKGGEKPIWPITPEHPLSDNKVRSTDDEGGLHIVELVQFARAEYVSNANHGMKKDFEDHIILFPMYDAVMLADAMFDDSQSKRIFDTLEDCVEEIEELKSELTTIVHTQTPGTLRDHWDTPEVKHAGSKKGRLRKDRYSALLMAAYAFRRLHRTPDAVELVAYGGFAKHLTEDKTGTQMYVGAPEWFTQQIGSNFNSYGLVYS